MLDRVTVVLHNVFSVYRVLEMARLVYGLGFKTFIVTKASGAAAHEGVPQASRLAIKTNRNFFYLADLNDFIELFKPDKAYLFVPKTYARDAFNFDEVIELLRDGKNIALVFGGGEPGLSRRDMEMGEAVYIAHIKDDLGAVPLASIVLYELLLRSRIEYK